jgi:hypothetical protein
VCKRGRLMIGMWVGIRRGESREKTKNDLIELRQSTKTQVSVASHTRCAY